MTPRDRRADRRRFATGYALSILIHLTVIALVSIVALPALREEGDREEYSAPQEIVVRPFSAQTPTPAPVVQVQPQPAPVQPAPPHELARTVPSSPPQPTPHPAPASPVAIPTPVVAFKPEPLTPVVALTAVPTIAPTVRPTVVPTVEPTIARTPTPTLAPTLAPTVAPTVAPTIAPTIVPTIMPTIPPTAAPTMPPTAIPTVAPSVAPAVTATAPAAATPGPARVAAQPSAPPAAPAPIRLPAPAAAPATPMPSTPAPVRATAAPRTPARNLDALNDRLRQLSRGGPVDYTPKRVDLGNNVAQEVLDAYEKALAPPAEILARTFGLIWTTRTLVHADSIAYVYERTRDILGRELCKAYRITEHPLRAAPARFDASKAQYPGPLPNATPLIETVNVSCDDMHMQAVVPGSLKSPVPRQKP